MNFIQPHWPAPTQIRAYTTTRQGWGHEVKFQLTDRKPGLALQSLLNLPEEPIWVDQQHGICVVNIKPELNGQVADAVFTYQPNRVCAIVTADCLPILICNQSATCVAAIHAGWRSLAKGIIEETLAAIQQPPDTLFVWLGPAIGPDRFEVGQDVYDAFTAQDASSAQAFIPYTDGKWFANLHQLAILRLRKQGVSHIYGSNYCTHTQSDLFFSYRRDKASTGRMASVIWIDSSEANECGSIEPISGIELK